MDGIEWHTIFPSPQNGQTSQSCRCVHCRMLTFPVWCFRYLELIPSTTADESRIISCGVHRWTNLLSSVYMISVLTNGLYLLFHCPGLIEFHCSSQFAEYDPFVFTPETIFNPSRTPKNCRNRFLLSSIRFPNLEKLSWGVPHAYQSQPWPTKPVDSVLVNHFMPSLSCNTTLDWDVPSPSYSYFNEVFSQTDLS